MVGKNYYNSARLGVPGPGQYNNDTFSHLNKAPTWRIGTSSRDDELKRVKRENVPGPGMYSYTDRSGSAIKFGTEKRDKRTTNDTPGPGHYHIACSMVDVPKYLMSGGNFDPRFRYI